MIKLKLRLKAEFERILQDCDEMWVAAAMISDRGMQFIRENLNKDAKQHYIVGVGLPTTPSVWSTLKATIAREFLRQGFTTREEFCFTLRSIFLGSMTGLPLM